MSLNSYKKSVSLLLISTLFFALIQAFHLSPTFASTGTVTAPAAPTFALNTSNQDPGDFVISNFTDTLLVSIGFVNPPAGVTFQLPTTTGLTASYGYNFTGGKTQISFTASQADANAALAAMTVSTGSTNGTITIRVTASVNQSNTYYNPINGHYYEYVPRASTFARSVTPEASAYHLAQTRTLHGLRGYLATITSAQEQKFILSNVNATNIWIGASDDAVLLNEVIGAGTFVDQTAAEGKWYWIDGPEKGVKFWEGASSSGKWVHQTTSALLDRTSENVSNARYENWCTGNPATEYTLTSGRSMGEPNNWGSGEHYALEKWSGSACWNDYGVVDGFAQSGYLVEYSENWGDLTTFSGANFATASTTALVDNAARNVTATLNGNTSIDVTWSAPSGGVVTQYLATATSSNGGTTRSCTAVGTSCTITDLDGLKIYSVIVRTTFNDSSTVDSLQSNSVTTLAVTPPSSGGGGSSATTTTPTPTPTATPTPTRTSSPRPTVSPTPTQNQVIQNPLIQSPTPQTGTSNSPAPLVKRLIEDVVESLRPKIVNLFSTSNSQNSTASANNNAQSPNFDNQRALDLSVNTQDKKVVELPSLVLINDVPEPSKVVIVDNTTAQVVTPNGGLLNVEAKDGQQNIPVDNRGRVQMVRQNDIETEGKGLAPNSEFAVYLFSEPTLIGIGKTDSRGQFFASFPVEDNLPLGDHTLQVNGTLPDGKTSSISMPVVLVDTLATAQIQAMPKTILIDNNPVEAATNTFYFFIAVLIALIIFMSFGGSRLLFAAFRRRKDDEENVQPAL